LPELTELQQFSELERDSGYPVRSPGDLPASRGASLSWHPGLVAAAMTGASRQATGRPLSSRA
ncbi:MAG TPA: hypothetical protein VJK02_18455, partial [Anaerolineales bacterium]|nr:hypothetical protein [Anaerolineales bacterium]